MDALSVSAIVVSIITAISGLIAGLHIKKSNCFNGLCICETEEEKLNKKNSKSDITTKGNKPTVINMESTI
jgi:hypothetical protein